MTNGRLTWTERLDAIQARMNEATASDPQIAVPYFDRDEIERILLEVSNANLRDLSIEDLDLVANAAITQVSGASPIAYPATGIDLLSVTVDSEPAVEVAPVQYFQTRYGVTTKMYSVFSGAIYHTGTTATAQVLTYLPLATWQATYDILPPGYDQKTIEETCQILELADYAPHERV